MDKNRDKLSGNYIAGFVDGEGCFALKFRKDIKQNKGNKKFREYFYWGVEFVIQLRSDDIEILRLIKGTLKCGNINTLKNGEQARYSVQNAKENYEKIVPFFRKHRMFGKKGLDFELWAQAVAILYKHKNTELNIKKGVRGFINKQISRESMDKLGQLRNDMLTYKAKRDKDFKWGN